MPTPKKRKAVTDKERSHRVSWAPVIVHKQWWQSNSCTARCSEYGVLWPTSRYWKNVTCRRCRATRRTTK
jgi:hypothetical protein